MTNENTAQLVAGVLNPADMDTSVRAQDDLYRYVNGTWLRTVKIPDDRPSAGSFMELRDGAELACRQIIEDCAKQTEAGQASGEAYQIGALYKSFMDEAAVNAAGVAPLEADVAELFSASSKDELASVMGAKLFAIFHGPIGAGVEVTPCGFPRLVWACLMRLTTVKRIRLRCARLIPLTSLTCLL